MRTIDPLYSLRTFSMICVLMVSSSLHVRGELVIEVGQGGLIGLPSMDVMAGEALTVDLYITQTAGTNRLNDVGTSVNSAEVELTIEGGTGLKFVGREFGNYFADDIGLTELSDRRLLFSVGSTKPPSAGLGGEVPGVLAREDGVDDNSLRLGSFHLQTDSLASGTYTINLEGGTFAGVSTTTTPDTGLIGMRLQSNFVLVNVTAVPESGSLLCLAVITLGISLRLRPTVRASR